tara:strand:- start:256 stop:777 length:522 start_codon:yes stop_codon:yes gene_type:complete
MIFENWIKITLLQYINQNKLLIMNESILDNDLSSGGAQITSKSQAFLKETAKWTGFLSILGFIGVGFIVLAALLMLTVGSSFMARSGGFGGMQAGILAFVYLIMAAIYFFPVLYMYNFSKKMKKAVRSGSAQDYENGFDYLKRHFKYAGIVAIVILSLYVLMFFVGLLGAAMY